MKYGHSKKNGIKHGRLGKESASKGVWERSALMDNGEEGQMKN